MNIDTLAGEGTNLKGRFKEGLGDAIGDPALQQDGAMDQISGNARVMVGKVRDFVRERPFVSALAALVAGGVLLGRRRRARTN